MPERTVETPLGRVTLVASGEALTELYWGRSRRESPSPLLDEAVAQIAAYFAGGRRSFDLPVAPGGTAHDRAVWQAMRDIPSGETRTYGEIARTVGSSPRAVGNACGRNRLPIIVPCHRIVGANGALGGYSGPGGQEGKRFLLGLEGARGAVDAPRGLVPPPGSTPGRASDFLPRRVGDRLRADDSALELFPTSFLSVDIGKALYPLAGTTRYTPGGLLRASTYFVRRLRSAASEAAGKPSFVDPGKPDGPTRFRRSGNIIVAYQKPCGPVWFWERKNGQWELNCLTMAPEIHEADDRHPIWDRAALRLRHPFRWGEGNRPRLLSPPAILGVLWYFKGVLDEAVARVAECPCLPDIGEGEGRYYFRADGDYAVAYRCEDDEPLWCWKRQQTGQWKQYRIQPYNRSRPPEPRELCDGHWD